MSGKKKKIYSKIWKLAGEAVEPMEFTLSEQHCLTSVFSAYREYKSSDVDASFDVPSSLIRARENVARASASFFCQHFKKKYRRADVIDALVTAVALPVKITEWFANTDSALLGATFWILDYIELWELEEEFIPLLPLEANDEIDYLIPMAEDLTHRRDIVLRLIMVLRGRKSKYATEFHKVIDLIRKDAAAELRTAFKEVLLDYFDRFLEVRTRITASSPVQDELSSLSQVPPASDLFEPSPLPFPTIPFPTNRKIMEKSPDIYFLLKTSLLIGASSKEIHTEFFYRRMTDLISGFTLKDPYQICAAYLLLEKEDDILINLNTLTDAVLICAERHLPWAYEEPDNWASLFETEPAAYALRYPFQPPREEEEDKPDTSIKDGQMLSECQLFYLATGYLLPRDRKTSPELVEWFSKQGVTKERAHELAMAAMLVSRIDDSRAWEDWLPPDLLSEPEENALIPETSSDDADKIAELQRQLKASRQALHDTEQSVRQLQERLVDKERQAMRDRMELSRLRESIFHLKAEENLETSEMDIAVEFPWTVKRRILIFGGHDTWSKAIKPLLPGARFFERETLPDLNAIKGADVIWIQANALSHKFYYRIIETARKEDIAVRYFGFASAKKCAEQLVSEELAAEES